MDLRKLGEEVAREILAKKMPPASPKGKIVFSLAQDISAGNQEILRVLRDACSDPMFEALLSSSSKAEMLLKKEAIIDDASGIYSSRMVAEYEQFLDGLIDYYAIHSDYITVSQFTQISPPDGIAQASALASAAPAFSVDASAPPSRILAPESSLSVNQGTPATASPMVGEGGRRASSLVGFAVVGALALGSGLTYVLTHQGHRAAVVQDSAGASHSGQGQDAYDEIISSGKLRVGAQAESPPMNYVENGKRTGLDFEILSLAARQQELGLSRPGAVEGDVNVDDYSAIPGLLRTTDNRGKHRVDVIAGGLTLKDGDVEGVNFTIPYLDGFGYALLVPKGSPIKSISQLNGKRVGIIEGDPDVEAYVSRTIKGAKIVSVSDASETWQQDNFSAGKVDAIVYDFPFASVELKGAPVDITISRLPGSNLEYRFGVRAEDKKLLGKLNDAIRRVKDTPEYVALLRRYLPMDNVVVPSKFGKNTYVVKSGDSLASIAAEQLGSADKWTLLQGLNNLPNPNFIDVGQVIIISGGPQ